GGGGGAGNSGGTRPGPEGWPERCGSSHGVTRLAALAGIAGTITASSAKARRVLIALLSAPALLLTSALNLSRSFVVSARPPDLFDRANYLFGSANVGECGRAAGKLLMGQNPWSGGEWSPLERPAKPCQRSGAKAGRQCQSFGKRSRPYLPQVVPADPIAGAVHPFSENATLVPLALRQRDNRCDLVGYDIEEPITDGPSDFHCHVTLSSALPLDDDQTCGKFEP